MDGGASTLMVAGSHGPVANTLSTMRKTPKPLPVIHLRSKDQKQKRQWDAALEDALATLGEIDFLSVSPPDDKDHGGLCALSDL